MTASNHFRTGAILLLLAGLALVAVLVARSEFSEITDAFQRLGLAGFGLIIAAHLSIMMAMGWAWSRLGGMAVGGFLRARLLRDSASEVLPLSQVGGFVLGGRALVLAGARTALASALTVVDVTAELVAQMGYTAIGLILLAGLRPGTDLAVSAVVAVLAMVVLLGGFLWVQVHGAARAVRVVMRLAGFLGVGGEDAPDHGAALQAELRRLHRMPRALVACTLWHLVCWSLVGLETWLLCRLLGAPVGIGAALVIDSLISGVRSVAFMVPQALGVQEGGYIMLGALFGLTPETALALSLVRRARDIVIGAPVLAVWQMVEGRRALARR